LLIGIAGGSGSGKTTFAKKILSHLDHPDVEIIHQDSYYLSSPPSHLRVHGELNFDHPDAFDWELLRKHLGMLRRHKAIEVPIYDFQSCKRLPEESIRVGPCKAVILEGIYSLWDTEIRALLDLKIFLQVEADVRFIRRLHRDVRERGRTVDSIIRQYYDTVRPMHHDHLEPTRVFADLIVGEESDIASGVIAAEIRDKVART